MITAGKLAPRRAFILSPFATAPLDAGQRLRAFQSTKFFQSLGYEITFLLYAFESDWYWRSQSALIAEMRAQWSDVRVIYSARQVGQPPKTGDRHQLDEWWDPIIGETLARIFEFEKFDIFVVHNVWLSKAFDFVPSRIVKVLETHDIFFQRNKIYEEYGILDRFLLIDQENELNGLRRADISITIKSEEEDLLKRIDKNLNVVTVPYARAESSCDILDSDNRTYVYPDKVVFGFLGGPHAYNLAGLLSLIAALNQVLASTFSPVELVVAGGVCAELAPKVKSFSFQPKLIGYVDNELGFYNSVDIAIVPVFFGTGFKVKVSEILSIAKPILCAAHASEGAMLPTSVISDSPEDLALRMSGVAFERTDLNVLSGISVASAKRVSERIIEARGEVEERILNVRRSIRAILPIDRWPVRNTVRLISHILHARVVSSHWNYVVELGRDFDSFCEKLNLLAQPGLAFCECGGDMRSSVTIFDEADSNNFTPRFFDNDTKAIIDLRYRENTNDEVVNGGLGSYFTNHLQSSLSLAIIPGNEVFPVPLLNDAVRWDPCVRFLISSMGIEREFLHAGCSKIILCANARMASLAHFVRGSIAADDARVLVADDNDFFNEFLSYLLNCVCGRKNWHPNLEVILTDQIDTWVVAFIEEICQYSCGNLDVRYVKDFIALGGENLIIPDGPTMTPSAPGIFWNMFDRLFSGGFRPGVRSVLCE